YSLVAQFRGLARGCRRRPQHPLPADVVGLARARPPGRPGPPARGARPPAPPAPRCRAAPRRAG
ncbi:hypothetical protein, partial [Kitasatospora sp. NPDC059571]|uniref:hypothetical protein n=1 Tax=Kitasatospora sp. NPDC059571 TaxID=3346871 RepID=UPI00368EA7A6